MLNKITAKISSVSIVDGNDFHASWKKPMCKIITSHGVFIDYHENHEAWLEACSHDSWTFHIEPCKRTWKHTWAKLYINGTEEIIDLR